MDHARRFLAPSTRATQVAARIRNQCNLVIGYHFAPSPRLEENGEAWLIRALAHRLRTFLDVGANVGEWTEAVLAHAPRAQGIAFEPGTLAAERLAARMPDLEVCRSAVGDRNGRIPFREEPDAGETSSVLGPATSTVPMVTLDSFLAEREIGPVDLVKIDTEGYDYFVLLGAEEHLSRQAFRAVQFEYNLPWGAAGATLGGAYRLLRGHGYEVFVLTPNGLQPFDYERYGEFFSYANFVALGHEALAELAPERG